MLISHSLALSCKVLLVSALAFFAGCKLLPKSTKPGDYDVRFQLDAALAGSSIQIDIVGANALSDLPKWESYSVNDYWKPGDAMRRDALKAIISFGRGKESVQSLSMQDEIWRTWLRSGATYLVIVADLPGGGFVDRTGNADPRRLILPLSRGEWGKDTREIRILVQESGMRLLTPRGR